MIKHTLTIPLFLVFIWGCSIPQPTTKNIYIPVRCNATLPSKPHYDPQNLSTVIDLVEYYDQVEALLIECTKEND